MLSESKELKPITFTDNPNYRIYDFSITPFAIYLNNGSSIDKYYLASGITEVILRSSNISSFIITPSDELIYSEQQKRELIFLDFTNNIKFEKNEIKANHLCFANDQLYILTKKALLISDEYANILESKEITKKVNKIFADSTHVIIFSSGERLAYLLEDDWKAIELPHGIRDMSGNNRFIVMLDENGSTLYIYSSSLIE